MQSTYIRLLQPGQMPSGQSEVYQP